MSYTRVGIALARQMMTAMRRVTQNFWAEWGSRYDGLSDTRKEELQQELTEQLEACRPLGGGGIVVGADDKFAVDADDAAALGTGYGAQKLIGSAAIPVNTIGTAGSKQLQVAPTWSDDPGLADCEGGDPGTSTASIPRKDHRHALGPGPDPSTEGARLYPAAIPATNALQVKAILAPLQRWADVDCAMSCDSPESGDPLSGWTESPSGTFTAPFTGAIPSAWIDGLTAGTGQDIDAGSRVLVRWLFNEPVEGSSARGSKVNGPYDVLNPGGPSAPAQIRRCADADASSDFLTHKIINVLQGTTYGGHTFLYSGADNPTLGTDPLTFVDHGTDSIYKAKKKFGFGEHPSPLLATTGGICQWVSHIDDGFPQGAPYRYLGADGRPTGAPVREEKFLVWAEYEEGDGYIDESAYFGVYEWVAVYDAEQGWYTQVLRRCPEMGATTAAGLTNLVVGVTGAGMLHDGEFIQQTATIETIDDDATEWGAWTSTNPSPPTDKLLTFAQLGQAAQEMLVVSQPVTNVAPVTLWSSPLPTLDGTPGILELPAGLETFQIGAGSIWVNGWNPDDNPGTVTLTVKLNNGTTGDLIFAALCPFELTPTANLIPWNWQYALAATVALAKTDLLSYNVEVASTCAQPVTVCMVYSRYPTWDTWVQLAGVQFALPGTDNHQLLSRRDQDVADADTVKADPCHPWSALGPAGRKHTKLGTATLTGSETTRRLVMPADSSVARLVPATSEVIYGIDRTGFSVVDVDTSDEIRVHVFATPTYNVTFVHDATETVGGDAMLIEGIAGKNMTFDGTTIVRFCRDPDTGADGAWRML